MSSGNPVIRNEFEISKLAAAGRHCALFFQELQAIIRPGLSTIDLEDLACGFCDRYGLIPTFKTVPRYHHALCTSINEEVVHGIPNKKKIIKDGDIVKVDFGVTLDGFIGDSCRTFMVGNVPPVAKKLCASTEESLRRAIAVVKPGATLGDVGHAIQSYIEPLGFSIVREYTGHGVGTSLPEPPTSYHYGKPGTGLVLAEGMVLAIEPMINEGDWPTEVLRDGWTVVTADRKLSAQFEHTVAVTKSGHRILTAL
jgi:methionyl aminopeptidase